MKLKLTKKETGDNLPSGLTATSGFTDTDMDGSKDSEDMMELYYSRGSK